MRRMIMAGLAAAMVWQAGVPAAGAEKKEKDAAPAQQTAQASSSQNVIGEIIRRTIDDKHPNLVYLRIKDDHGRVWLMTLDSAKTDMTGSTGIKPTMHDFMEGARVEATFPRGGEDVPVAEGMTLL